MILTKTFFNTLRQRKELVKKTGIHIFVINIDVNYESPNTFKNILSLGRQVQ